MENQSLIELSSDKMCFGEGQPVYLTPHLREGLIHQAQNASKVSIPYLESGRGLDSWSGYISVGQNFSNHLFFWYFLCTGLQTPKDHENETDVPYSSSSSSSSSPLLVWLNGGPGYSSMVGLFEEIGPLKAHTNGTVTVRDKAWTDYFDVLFIDNPMNTGFSYSDSGEATQSVKEAAGHLNEFLDQFFQLFPKAKSKPLYIGGQSYGGKYVPELAELVRKDTSINLKGIFVGSGLFDSSLMIPLTPDYLSAMGMINNAKAKAMKSSLLQSLRNIKSNPEEAVMEIVGCIFNQLEKSIGHNDTGSILYVTKRQGWTLEPYLNQPEVQQAIHVRPTKFVSFNKNVILAMAQDFPLGVQDVLDSLLDSGIKVLVFNGQMDPLVTVEMTEKFLASLSWSGIGEYQASDSTLEWMDGTGAVAGYVTKVANFTRVVIRNAGHRTAIDQPDWVLDMMKQFIYDLPFGNDDE